MHNIIWTAISQYKMGRKIENALTRELIPLVTLCNKPGTNSDIPFVTNREKIRIYHL